MQSFRCCSTVNTGDDANRGPSPSLAGSPASPNPEHGRPMKDGLVEDQQTLFCSRRPLL